MNLNRREFLEMTLALAATSGCATLAREKRWYKGMVHCHSLWSDGKAFPEQVVTWYRSRGYNFLTISDHNQFQANREVWALETDKSLGWRAERKSGRRSVTKEIVDRYLAAFPDVKPRVEQNGRRQLRLKTFDELVEEFNVPGVFELVPGTELTHNTILADGRKLNVHMNLINVPGVPASFRKKGFKAEFAGRTADEIIAEKIAEAKETAAEFGRRGMLILNHPIWKWYDITPENLIAHPEVRFFEACNNGSPLPAWEILPQDGLDTDRFWDVVNAFRAKRGEPLLYGVGNDDTHHYFGGDHLMLMPGNAWTRVRSRSLAFDDLLDAMEEGDFMTCEGLEAEDVRFDRERGELTVAVAGAAGERRKVSFIVSKRDFSERPLRTIELRTQAVQNRRTINVYDERIGKTVKTVVGEPGEALTASYRMAADDLYVRARVESPAAPLCKAYLHPHNACCWTQPYQR